MTDPIATRDFLCLSPAGEQFSFTVQIGRPVPMSDEADADWHCPVTVPFDGRIRYICGIDSWQALQLAVSFVHFRLANFLGKGGKLYYPGTTEEFTLEDFPQAAGSGDF